MKNEKVCISHDIPIFRERIELLRGKTSQKDFSKGIGVDVRTYQNWIKPLYKGYNGKMSYTLPTIETALKICDKYHVSLDWLFNADITCTTVENQAIYDLIGLNDDGIKGLKSIKQSDDNYIFNKQPGLCVLPVLNKLLGYRDYFERILRALRDFLHNDYVVPVYHVENKQASKKYGVPVATTVQSDNEHDYIQSMDGSNRIYIQHFARTNDINDNIPIAITSDFLQGVAVQQLTDTLKSIKQDMTH